MTQEYLEKVKQAAALISDINEVLSPIIDKLIAIEDDDESLISWEEFISDNKEVIKLVYSCSNLAEKFDEYL